MRAGLLASIGILVLGGVAGAASVDPFAPETEQGAREAPETGGSLVLPASPFESPIFGSPAGEPGRPAPDSVFDPAFINPDAGIGPVERGRREAEERAE